MLNEKLEAVLGEKGLVLGDALTPAYPSRAPRRALTSQSTEEVAAALRL